MLGASGGAAAQGVGNYADVNGLRMYYEVHGEGFPLVLIHGGGSTIGTTFGRILPALAKSHLAEVGTSLVKTATEVHGGIGFTEDYDLHFFFKRVALDRQLLGGPDYLRDRAAHLQELLQT